MFVVDRVAELVVLGSHPGILLVAVGVEFGERFEALLGLAVVDEPSERVLVVDPGLDVVLRNLYLGDSGKNMISSPRTTAGMTWIPKLRRHCIESSSEKFLFVPNVVQEATKAPIPSMNCCSAVTLPRIEGCAISA